jgi:hypothetical protein
VAAVVLVLAPVPVVDVPVARALPQRAQVQGQPGLREQAVAPGRRLVRRRRHRPAVADAAAVVRRAP